MRVGLGIKTVSRQMGVVSKKAVARWRHEEGFARSSRTWPKHSRSVFAKPKQVKPPKPKPIKLPKVAPATPAISDAARQLRAREYYAKNKVRIAARTAARIVSEPQFRLTRNLRKRIWKVVTEVGGAKMHHTMDLTMCTSLFLRKWIESQFIGRMTWANYGRAWEIDHVTPCSSFNLEQESEQRKCFHYSNLRPMRKAANRKKHASIVVHQPQLLLEAS